MNYQIEISDKPRTFHNRAERIANEVRDVLGTSGVYATVEPVENARVRTFRVTFEGKGEPVEAALAVFVIRWVNETKEAFARSL